MARPAIALRPGLHRAWPWDGIIAFPVLRLRYCGPDTVAKKGIAHRDCNFRYCCATTAPILQVCDQAARLRPVSPSQLSTLLRPRPLHLGRFIWTAFFDTSCYSNNDDFAALFGLTPPPALDTIQRCFGGR